MSEVERNLNGRAGHRGLGDRGLHPRERGENGTRPHRAGDHSGSAHCVPASDRVYEAASARSFQSRNPAYSRAILWATPFVITAIVIFIVISEALK